jgi:hypothetical protein
VDIGAHEKIMRAQPKASARLINLNSYLAFVCENGVFLDDVEFLRFPSFDNAYDVPVFVRGVCMFKRIAQSTDG